MKTIHISQTEFDNHDPADHDFGFDFSDVDEPTQPFVRISVAQAELDTAESVVNQLLGTAQVLGYSVDPPKHWAEQLNEDLDVIPLTEEDILFDILEDQ